MMIMIIIINGVIEEILEEEEMDITVIYTPQLQL
jgi:hypothetical protein